MIQPWTAHPATFSEPVLQEIAKVPIAPGSRVLDPFAGTGKIHSFEQWDTWGVEIEPEGAVMHPRTIIGDATNLPFSDGIFDAVVTSPVYGNRMSDHHEAKEICKACGGLGLVNREGESLPLVDLACEKCGGAGRRQWKRHTYRHSLPEDRPLHERNAGRMNWGPRYRDLHVQAWQEVWRVLRPGGCFVLNISNHIRKHDEVDVVGWHADTITKIGFTLSHRAPVKTRRNGQGANREARAESEWLVTFLKLV